MKYKIFVASLSLLFSSPLFAAADAWTSSGVDSTISPLIKVQLFNNVNSDKNIGLIFPSKKCSQFEKKVLEAQSYVINNIPVKTLSQCIDKGDRMDFPATVAGRKYVINEFKSKNMVIYIQNEIKWQFSAKGFTKALLEAEKK